MKFPLVEHFICGRSSFDIDSVNTQTIHQARSSRETDRSSTTIQVSEKKEDDPLSSAQISFEVDYPVYHSPILDEFRKNEYARLGDLVYLDYTGASLYPACLVSEANEILLSTVLGNPHSSNPASWTSSKYTTSARQAVLQFFDADPEVYSVVWTTNATGGAKIVAEAYPWQIDSILLLPSDAHNSINGIRQFARVKGAKVEYYDVQTSDSENENFFSKSARPGLFCLTGQSNVSGYQGNLALIKEAASQGYHTLLDAAALAPSTRISLSSAELDNSVDAMIVSLYKIMGYPTGLGALVIKKTFLDSLEKPWFCGGTVDIVQVPGSVYTLEEGVARLEDGTSNFLAFNVVPRGLSLVSALIPSVKPRISSLTHWLMHTLSDIRHPWTSKPLVYIRSPPLDISYDTLSKHYGGTIAFEVADADGAYINCEAIEYAAGKANICIRSGCVCNPGGTSDLTVGQQVMCSLRIGDTKQVLEDEFGIRTRGIVRVSFGIASNFADAWHFVQFMRSLTAPMRLFELGSEWEMKRRSAS